MMMMMQRKMKGPHAFYYLILLLVSLGIFSNRIQSIRFDMQSAHGKCIAESIKQNAMTVGKYHVVNPDESHPLPDSHKIIVRVTSMRGQSYHEAMNVTEGHFAFNALEDGDYMACFFANQNMPPVFFTIDFDWKSGVAAKDWSNVAKKGSVELMALELKKMFDNVKSIQEEMFYLRAREEEMQDLNRLTTSKMAWLSFLSLFMCLSVAGLQLWHLKSFFEKKKLL